MAPIVAFALRYASGVGAIPVANTPEKFREFLRRDVAKWAKVIKENNIKVD